MYFQLEAENYVMGLASVIYNGVQAPLKFDSVVLRFSHPVRPPKLTALHLFHSQCHAHTLCSVGHNRRGRYSPITVCSKGTEQEHDLSTSASERSSTQSYDNINKSHTSTSVDSPEKQVDEHESFSSSIKTVAFCVCTAVAFGLGVGLKEGVGKASEFFAGMTIMMISRYILEQSLSVDNLFVFVLVFKYFKVPVMYQKRVLSYGIAGAVIFRLTLILLGTATLQRFEAVNLLLAAILLFSSVKLFSSEDDDSDLSDNFIVKTCQRFIPVTSNLSIIFIYIYVS
ncbi:hypothetical protein Patl1_31987 [Pistacia atlantica]|uniref:Uncharacterized protein n=1 Tax=Pistacia atlantica TaxID=434234 RepID=A0ACC1AN97_9ROSI|nr:hypothetical protein Patl1_31987 [Pistacia atlantica]